MLTRFLPASGITVRSVKDCSLPPDMTTMRFRKE
nr:MAG TPA: hypothetical protein [Bacteriophage sp.]